MIRLLAAALICAVTTVERAAGQTPGTAAPPPAASSDPTSVEELTPACKKTLVERAKHCFELPDGRLFDADQYYAFRDAINKVCTFEQRGHWVSSGNLKSWVAEPSGWEIRTCDLSSAWNISSLDVGLGVLGRPERSAIRVEGYDSKLDFVFIDETSVDNGTRAISGSHYSKVLRRLAGDVAQIDITALGQPCGGSVYVVGSGAVNGAGYLPGTYALVPAPDVTHPVTRRIPNVNMPASTQDWVYRYVPLTKGKVTPDRLLKAITSGGMELTEWTWKREGGRPVWTEDPVVIVKRPAKASPARP